MLEAALKKDPTDQDGWLSLARLEFLDHDATAAIALLARGRIDRRRISHSTGWRVVYSVQLPEEQAKEALKAAATNAETFSEDEQDRLYRTIGMAYFRINDMAGARTMWSKVAQKKPNDPDAQFTLFDISVREEDDAAIDRSVETIKRLFGPGSPEAKFVEARTPGHAGTRQAQRGPCGGALPRPANCSRGQPNNGPAGQCWPGLKGR